MFDNLEEIPIAEKANSERHKSHVADRISHTFAQLSVPRATTQNKRLGTELDQFDVLHTNSIGTQT